MIELKITGATPEELTKQVTNLLAALTPTPGVQLDLPLTGTTSATKAETLAPQTKKAKKTTASEAIAAPIPITEPTKPAVGTPIEPAAPVVAPEIEVDLPQVAAPTIPFSQVDTELRELYQNGKNLKICQKLLTEFKIQNVKQLPTEKYPDFLAAVRTAKTTVTNALA